MEHLFVLLTGVGFGISIGSTAAIIIVCAPLRRRKRPRNG